jgi:hypothetical protein
MNFFRALDKLSEPVELIGGFLILLLIILFIVILIGNAIYGSVPDICYLLFVFSLIVGPLLVWVFPFLPNYYLQNSSYKHSYYKDFNYFTANTDVIFDNWTESDSKIKIPDCNVKVFKSEAPVKGKITISSNTSIDSQNINYNMRRTTVTTRQKYHETDVNLFFEVIYMQFNNNSKSNKDNIDKVFEKRQGLGKLGYFHKNNIHIICHAYCKDLSRNPFDKEIFVHNVGDTRVFWTVDDFLEKCVIRFKRSVELKK